MTRTALVTGAARGLGRAMADALVGAGFRVAAIDVDFPQETPSTEALLPFRCDIVDPVACEQVVAAVDRWAGRVDALINNAGRGMELVADRILSGSPRFDAVATGTWRNIVDVNVNGTYHMTRAALPYLKRGEAGKIVNVVTSYQTMVREGFSPYGPTKAAIEAMTRIWASELSSDGISVNALLPGGPANTRMIPQADAPDRSTLIQPEVMCAPAVWLCSLASNGVTGRRFIGAKWNPAAPLAANIEAAGAPAGF